MGQSFDGLLSICEQEGVGLSYQPLDPENGLLGMYFEDHSGQRVILLDKTLETNRREERCVLAEEVGHYKTTGAGTIFVVDFSYNTVVHTAKVEDKANRWGADYLMPTPCVAEAIRKGRRTPHELADFFYVTKWMMWKKINALRSDVWKAFGLRVSAKEIFSPLFVREMWGWSEAEHVFF